MSKLFIIIGLLLAFLIIKHLINSASRSKTLNNNGNDSENSELLNQSTDYKNTVQCQYCGTHIPSATAYQSGDEHYCDESHYKKAKN